MIKLKNILKEYHSRQYLQKIMTVINNGQNLEEYLFDMQLPSGVYKKLLNHPNIDVNARNNHGDIPLHTACRNNHIQIIKLLLQHPKINVNVKGVLGNTPLHKTCLYDTLQIVELLLQHPKINVNVRNINNYTPLHYACSLDKLQIVKLLLQHPDVDVNVRNKLNRLPEDLTNYKQIKQLIRKYRQEHNL